MSDRLINILLKTYVGLAFAFIFAPIAVLVTFSFNADRFPSLPWAGFSLDWYVAILNDRTIREAFANSLIVGVTVSVISTALGFTAAYVDFRWKFTGQRLYLALAILPPTIPLIVLGLSLLIFLSRVGLSGALHSVIISHVVFCLAFAVAIIRMRLAEMDPALEEAAWNLGAGPWRAIVMVILPFAAPAIVASLLITMAVSFDEFMIAWFVAGLDETLPVRILALLQGQVSPRINAIGTIVFSITITLIVVAQLVLILWKPEKASHTNGADQREGNV